MDRKESLRSSEVGFKALPGRRLRVLLVEDDPLLRGALAERLGRDFHAEVRMACSAREAEQISRGGWFDVLIFGNPDWESGTLLYLDLLNQHRSPCQFILFIAENAEVPAEFAGLVRVVRKPAFDGILQAVGWMTTQAFG